ncbi:hypothetical protein Q5530_26940 [Saccharothrix sp. BKS2]|uniref:hypothetical protein n=1 Tax=Saccharothrix sp. BKS2 TaxID=3064400 RepID=UPI0039E7F519
MRLALPAAVLVVTGCTPPPPEPSSPSRSVGPSGVEVDEPAGEQGFAVGPASWRTGPDGPLASVPSATVAGGAAVLVGTGPTPRPPGAPGAVAVFAVPTGVTLHPAR